MECMLYVFVGVFTLTENVLSGCLFLKNSFSPKCDFSREMTSYKHGLVYFNMKKNSLFTAYRRYPYNTILFCVCPASVGLTETQNLDFYCNLC